MNTERLFNVVMMELTTDKMKLEDELEMVINSKDSIDQKSARIQTILARLTNLENSIAKFSNLINNNNNNNQKED
jgi:hypothetical protein